MAGTIFSVTIRSAFCTNKSKVQIIKYLDSQVHCKSENLAGRLAMEAMTAIFTRKSIRRYKPKPVSAELVTEILKAAMSAPSAGNERPWHFLVLTDRALLDEIPKFHPYAGMLKQASVAVLVCGDPSLEKYAGYWVLDCSAATENVLLAAHAKGLGGVWCGVYPTADRVANLKKLLRLPDQVVPFSLIPLGFPDENKQVEERFDPSRVHHNGW
jgi:nitroreductase